MSQTATIRRLPQAFEIIKEMRAEGYEWGEDDRGAGREVLAEILEGRMAEAIDRHLDEMALPVLGVKVSTATVSRIARTLDAAVAACHSRPLSDHYRVLMLDGVVLA